MDTTTISAIAMVCAALVTAWFGYISHKGRGKVEQVNAVLDAYNEIVRNLQNEVGRLSAELLLVREELKDCERRSDEMQRELEELRGQIAKKPATRAKKTVAKKTAAPKRTKAS